MAVKIFRINYKSDFILTLHSDAGWMTPFCIKFWTGAPSQAYFVGYDGTTYTHCAPVEGDPTKLVVQFDDHHLPIGNLQFQIAYHFTVADFPNDTEDEVINPASIIIEIDGEQYQVMLDFTGETAPEIEFSLPAYANEDQRIANEEQRIAAEQQRIANEDARIQADETRQQNEQQRIAQETARVNEFATLKSQSQAATRDANDAATLANQKAQLAADKAALADDAATLANQKAQLAADKAALADAAATLANDKAALAQQKAEYAQQQGSYAKDQGDYAKSQGNYANEQGEIVQADHVRAEADHGIAVDDHTQAGNDHTRAESDHGIAVDDHTQAGNDHTRAESDHGIAADDHTQAGNDHTRAESDHGIAANDHTQAGNDHTRAESDHTRAEGDHAAVEVYVDSLGAFDISAYHATGGVLAKYADLTDALGTGGANIPDALRKGGMSVKFVQSSDNKYVQYRYMEADATTAATFTNVDNWQGVDDAPTAGSDNLVKSGGVQQKFVQIEQETINEKWKGSTINNNPNNFFIYNGYYSVNSGTWHGYGSYWTSVFIKISDIVGLSLIYSFPSGASANAVTLFTGPNDSDYLASYNTFVNYKIDVSIAELAAQYPTATYIRFSTLSTYLNTLDITPTLVGLNTQVQQVNASMQSLSADLNQRIAGIEWLRVLLHSKYNTFFTINGYYKHSNGEWSDGGSYWTTPFLKLTDLSGAKIKYSIPFQGSPDVAELFDSNQQRIAQIYPLQANEYEQQIDDLISSYPTAIYVRFTIGESYFSSFIINPNLVAIQNEIDTISNEIIIITSNFNSLNSALQLWRRSDGSVFNEVGFYNSSGIWSSEGSYTTTDFIKLVDLNNLIISYDVPLGTSANRITLFDSSKTFVAAITSGVVFNFADIIVANPTAVYARLTIFTSNISTFKVKQSNIEIYNLLLQTISDFNTEIATMQQEISDVAALPSSQSAKIFRRVGVIGDSYTAGYIQITGGSPNNTYPGWSWVHYMQQLTGETWDNYGRGGSTARTWVLGQERLNEIQKEGNKAQAYIIGLGINDIGSANSHPLGTIDDILTDNDSFYAWYYKLINLILAVNTNAKIFCNTLPQEGTTIAQWNQAIREVVEYCHDTENKGVYCCDLASSKYMTSSFYKNPIFTNNFINGHYDAIGYQFMAECYVRVLSDVVLENYEEMRYVFQLPFDQPNKDVYGRLLRGSTADRPTMNDYYPPTVGPKVGAPIYIGYCYFDTTIGKPIYWNGTNWVDATGNTV